ncbi:unnamed protein product [Pedinophyceae sp. YPF-701]|nr:unnamed protein product [Pedinophyceae sp. YPF-701]
MEKALKEMEVAMRSTDRATREVERASLMLEEDLSVTLEQVELASLEFEDLGHSLNSIVGRRSSAPSRRRSAADSRGSSSPSRNGSKATATTAATASRDGASRAEASASRSSSPSSSRRSRSTRSIVRQQRMRRDASRAAAVMAAADVAAGRADESVLVRTVDLDSGGEEEERSGSELTGSMDGEPARPSREKEGGSGPGLTARVVRDLQTTAAQLGSLTMGVGAMSAGALSDAMALAQRLTGSAGVWSQQIIRTAGQVNEVIAREETGRPTAKRWIASWRLRQSMDEDEDTPLPADVRPATTPPGLTLASRDAQLVITDVGPAAPAATPDVVDVAAAAATAPAAQPAEAPAATEESALVVSDAASPPDGAVIDAEVAADADGAAASEPEESDPINQDDFERMAQAFTGTIQGVLDNAQDALRARRRLTAEQEVVLALERAKDAARAAAQSSQELEDAIWRANQAGIELGDSDLREPGGGVPEDALLSDDESGMGQTWVQMLGAAWETEDEEAEEGGGPGKGRSLGSTLLAPDGGGDFYYDPGAPMGVDAATLEDDDEYWTSRAQERRRRQWKGDVYGETDDDASAAREGRGPPANQYWRED